MGRKILVKALISRINHQIYTTEFLNRNQYGFIPQTNKRNRVMALNLFDQELFSKWEITVIVSLDVV